MSSLPSWEDLIQSKWSFWNLSHYRRISNIFSSHNFPVCCWCIVFNPQIINIYLCKWGFIKLNMHMFAYSIKPKTWSFDVGGGIYLIMKMLSRERWKSMLEYRYVKNSETFGSEYKGEKRNCKKFILNAFPLLLNMVYKESWCALHNDT